MPQPVFMIAGSFSADSGGRTRATFTRASMLASAAQPVHVITFNLRPEYADVFAGWRSRTGANPHVHHANLFEHFSGGPLYFPIAAPAVYSPPKRATYIESRNAWRIGRGDDRLLVQLRDDGSVDFLRQYANGFKACRSDVDPHGRVIRHVHFAPDSPERSHLNEYVAPDGRAYLLLHRPPDGPSRYQLLNRDGSVTHELATTTDLRMRFLADLADAHPGAVFISEHRPADELLLDNRFRDDITSVAAIHSAHLEWDPQTGEHEPDTYNTPTLARMDALDAGSC